jgi:spore maturation protein CgeB
MGRSYQKIVCCDTINHATPILLEWAYGLGDLGYDVKYLPIPQHSILEINEEVDLLIYAGIQNHQIIEFEQFKKKYPNTIIIGAYSDWNPNYINFKNIVDFFIGAIDSYPSVEKQYNENGFTWYPIALAANQKFFYKEEQSKIYDSCFIGNLSHGYRYEDKYLYPILNNEKYKCFLGGMTYKNYNTGFIPYEDHNIIRNQTKINLNFHVPYQIPGKGEFPDRSDCNQSVFNIALSGNFQLCDHPLALEYFKGNIVIGNEENWLELFEYYLNNDQEREELAYNARQICLKEHTWLARMEEFIILTKKHYEK